MVAPGVNMALTPHLDLGPVTQLSPHWAGTFWDAPWGAMGEGARTGSCPFSPPVSTAPPTPPGPSEVLSALLPRGVGPGIWGLRRLRGSGPSRGAKRVPAGRGRGALRLQPSPRGARCRLFRASWPALRACRAHAGGRRRPIARAGPRPRAGTPRPLTCHRRRLAQHQPPSLPLRGQREREPPPAPAPPRARRGPDLLAVPQLDLALHQRRLGHLLSWFPRPAAPLPAAPRAAQPRVTFKIAPRAPCAGRRGGGRGGARGGRGRGASPPVLPHPRPAWAMRPRGTWGHLSALPSGTARCGNSDPGAPACSPQWGGRGRGPRFLPKAQATTTGRGIRPGWVPVCKCAFL